MFLEVFSFWSISFILIPAFKQNFDKWQQYVEDILA